MMVEIKSLFLHCCEREKIEEVKKWEFIYDENEIAERKI
jgi:hypothetical protein